MITAIRNLLIVLAGFICAFLVSALGQAAFSHLFPAFSSRIAANVDFATYFVLVLSALAYFLFGFMVPRWLRSSRPLLWLLTPIVSAYCLALTQPYPFRCTPFAVAGCWMIQSIFVVPAVSIAMGYLFRARRQRHGDVV